MRELQQKSLRVYIKGVINPYQEKSLKKIIDSTYFTEGDALKRRFLSFSGFPTSMQSSIDYFFFRLSINFSLDHVYILKILISSKKIL